MKKILVPDITQQLLQIILAVLPGLVFNILTHHHVFLIAAFLAACSIMPYGLSYSQKRYNYVMLLVILVCSIIVSYLLTNWLLLLSFAIILGLILAILDTTISEFKTISNWIFIGTFYGGVKLNSLANQITHLDILNCILLASVSIFLSTTFSKAPAIKYNYRSMNLNTREFWLYSKYTISLILTICLWHFLELSQPEWLIWSSLSVLNLEIEQSEQKTKDRMLGGLLGVGAGVVLNHYLPSNIILEHAYFIIILLSLRIFESYRLGFIVRCLFVILYSGTNFATIGKARIINIFLGGIIGYMLSKWLNKQVRTKNA